MTIYLEHFNVQYEFIPILHSHAFAKSVFEK